MRRWLLAAAALGACEPAPMPTPSRATALATTEDASATPDAEAPAGRDGGAVDATTGARPSRALTGVRVVALRVWTPVRRAPQRDGTLAGYLRAGAVVEAEEGPFGREGCAVTNGGDGGWYRVRGGGYVCVGGTWAAFEPARDFRAPAQPDHDAGMPYRYAVSYGRANMYRRVPTADEVRLYEPWRFPSADGGVDAALDVATARDAGPRDVPRPTLGELEGDPTTPVIRRMLTGMYVALDRVVRANGDRYWTTQSGGLVRQERLSELRGAPTFEGVWLADGGAALPMAWMVSEFGWRYAVTPDGRVSRGARAPRLAAFALTDEAPLTVGARTFYRTRDGGAVLAANVRRAAARPPPEGVGERERWLDVDLDEQVLVAYEGARPVYATLVSSGRRTSRSAPERFETPEGTFRIQAKHVTTTMDGDTVSDGPYSIEDVPWVMYFQGSYALHAAFWHQYFGWRMSHGCVNLSPPDARALFHWADPQLPAGWHGVVADSAVPGSRVEVRHSRANQNTEAGRPAGAARAVPEAPR